ncbi:DUF7282 domain-containing protein [Hyphomicrobium sp.]|jgi:hypothetical protein|uniref:DUF7282 domain-containing protein n=1 Tax=Hyphomicrobium sp. TaxID=82 RepID=UPI002BE5AAB9|nr:hypothetical protein [Hyphomicrobium sp.]HVZ03497.1 hypothetical protein [Hyphomicrobium sp.]
MPHIAQLKTAIVAASVAAALLASLPASAMTKDPASNQVQTQTPASVLVFNQKAGENSVKVSYVYLPDNGYVAIFADENGRRSDAVLGFTPLEKGNHNEVAVEIKESARPGSALWATLYKDVDGDKILDVRKDLALWPDSDPLEHQFLIE